MDQSRDTRDGFQLATDHFKVPRDASALDPKTKRALTICNLFVNHKLTLVDIIRVLDEDKQNVILALLGHQIVHDRRAIPRPLPDNTRRTILTTF